MYVYVYMDMRMHMHMYMYMSMYMYIYINVHICNYIKRVQQFPSMLWLLRMISDFGVALHLIEVCDVQSLTCHRAAWRNRRPRSWSSRRTCPNQNPTAAHGLGIFWTRMLEHYQKTLVFQTMNRTCCSKNLDMSTASFMTMGKIKWGWKKRCQSRLSTGFPETSTYQKTSVFSW